MSTSRAIAERIRDLPESAQREVLELIDHLRSRMLEGESREEDDAWNRSSLESAMRGMEDEPSPYTLADLRDSFR